MGDRPVERPELSVLRVRADLAAGGPRRAFDLLEHRLPSLKRRRFYGVFVARAEGEEYYACVVREPADEPARWGLDTGVIPGGWYLQRRMQHWADRIAELPEQFRAMARGATVDGDRPSLEFYRSHDELLLLLPIRAPNVPVPESSSHATTMYDARASIMDDEGRSP